MYVFLEKSSVIQQLQVAEVQGSPGEKIQDLNIKIYSTEHWRRGFGWCGSVLADALSDP